MNNTTVLIDFKRVNNDVNGNPRAVCHFLNFAPTYEAALRIAHKIGGRKFHNKQYGGGIVFQMYGGEQEAMTKRIHELLNQVNS